MPGRIVGDMIKMRPGAPVPTGNLPDMTDKGLPFEKGENEGHGTPEELFNNALEDLNQLQDALAGSPAQDAVAKVIGDLQALQGQIAGGGGSQEAPIAPGPEAGKGINLAG